MLTEIDVTKIEENKEKKFIRIDFLIHFCFPFLFSKFCFRGHKSSYLYPSVDLSMASGSILVGSNTQYRVHPNHLRPFSTREGNVFTGICHSVRGRGIPTKGRVGDPLS